MPWKVFELLKYDVKATFWEDFARLSDLFVAANDRCQYEQERKTGFAIRE